MAQVLLVNPARRGGKKRRARKGKAARRVKRSSARRSRRRNPARKFMRTTARRSVRRHRRRNPIGGLSLNGLKGMLMPAVWGGGGAVITDIGYRMLPVPGALSILKGTLAPVTKIGVAFLVAKAASMVVGKSKAQDMLSGALAVIAYGLVSDLALRFIPTISAPAAAPVAGYDFAGLGYNSPGAIAQGGGMNEYVSGGGMAEYVSGADYNFAG